MKRPGIEKVKPICQCCGRTLQAGQKAKIIHLPLALRIVASNLEAWAKAFEEQTWVKP